MSTDRPLPRLPAIRGRKAPTYSATNLRQRRRQLGLSTDDLGVMVGVIARTIEAWERHENTPTPGNRRRWVAAIEAAECARMHEYLDRYAERFGEPTALGTRLWVVPSW